MTDRAEQPGAAPRAGGGGFRVLLVLLPLVVFAGMAGLFAYRMASGVDSSEIPSALIGTPVPEQSFAPLVGLKEGPDRSQIPGFDTTTLQGEVSLVNVFASWCAPCRVEHPVLMALSETPGLKMVGVNYKDDTVKALSFLHELGNPYDVVGVDTDGRNSIDWGLYGVPETFLVGPDGVIVDKIVGPVEAEDLEGRFGDNLRRLLDEARAG